jgi:hypothetical protein
MGERDIRSNTSNAEESMDGETTEASSEAARLTRRRALKVIAAGAAGAATLPAVGCVPQEPIIESLDETAAELGESIEPVDSTASVEETTEPAAGNPLAAGTPSDPDLLNPVVPWEGILTEDELGTIAALCDVIIPEDEHSPSASAVGAHDFVNEWVSAPYEGNQTDLVLVRGGIRWLNVESVNRFGREFVDLSNPEKQSICDDISYQPRALPQHRAAARFFDKIRDLTATAFYTTEEGMADLGYIGNVPTATFDGPPQEVLERLGLTP